MGKALVQVQSKWLLQYKVIEICVHIVHTHARRDKIHTQAHTHITQNFNIKTVNSVTEIYCD